MPVPKEFLSLKIGEILVRKGWLKQEHCDKALQIQKKEEERPLIGKILLENGYVGSKQLYQGLALQHDMTFLDLDLVTIPEEVLRLVPHDVVRTHQVLPLVRQNDVLLIAIGNPKNIRAETEVRRFVRDSEVRNVLVCPDMLQEAILKYYGPLS